MKTFKTTLSILIIVSLITPACEDPLQEQTYSTLSPSNFYTTADDAESLLNSAYVLTPGFQGTIINRRFLAMGEMTTDILIQRGGFFRNYTQPLEDFEWSPIHPGLESWWQHYYAQIHTTNIILDRVPDIDMNPDRKEQILAEARFLRAFNYFGLYDLFGPTPIITGSQTSAEDLPSRPSEEEFITFVEDEFLAVSEILPASQEQYGRATSGAALGFLCKFYLNNKKWAEAAETAQQIIDTGVYSLFTQDSRDRLLAVENEGNSEMMFVSAGADNPEFAKESNYLSIAAPPGYDFEFSESRIIFAANHQIRSEFLELFEPEDERFDVFIFEYVNREGETIQLGEDNVRSFKYPEDPNGTGGYDGNDIPFLRYADILLSRAEALNELNGPNQESINLISQVREAAGVDPIELSDYSSKQALRNFILDERGREFHTEGLRRQDLIRHGKFIEMARERGKPAEDYHTRFPIPQSEMDVNPNLVQNEGY